MTVADLAKLVAHMRTCQREYFRTRSSGALDASRAAEKAVDRAVKECLDQPSLFGKESH